MSKLKRGNIEIFKVPSEIAIQNAVLEVEKLGADVKLTEAVTLLARAKDLVTEFVDKELSE